MQNKQQKQFKQ